MYTYVILLAYMHMCLDGRDENRCVYVCWEIAVARLRRDLGHAGAIQNKNYVFSLGHKGAVEPILTFWKAADM